MQNINDTFDSAEQLEEFLGCDSVREAVASATSILVQVFYGKPDAHWTATVTDIVQAALPDAVIVGVNSDGEISGGNIFQLSTVISLTTFTSSRVLAYAHTCLPGEEYATGKAIADTLAAEKNLQGILLLAPPAIVNCSLLLSAINEHRPGLVLFGGGSAVSGDSTCASVFLGAESIVNGAVAVAFTGDDLRIDSHVLFGWKPAGPTMKLDSVEGFNIMTIDGKPAFDVYRKYLNIEPGVDKDFFLLEFPLLIERNGCVLARNPISASQNGSVTLLADVYSGETAHLGYLDIDLVIDRIQQTIEALEAFDPEAIFIYSCICRRFTLQQDTEMEINPFEILAPVSGFFTYGEFCQYNGSLQLLNSSQVVVSMREGEPAQATQKNKLYVRENTDHFRLRHIRVTSRLIHMIGALTEELKAANTALQYQSEHDFLTKACNRSVMNNYMEKEVSRSLRHKHSFSVIMIDIDHFKNFNDVFGHAAGDHVLQEFAKLIQKLMRVDDTLFRYGGEEFLLLLPETESDGAMVFAEKCRKSVESLPMEYEGKKLSNIAASFGVASFPENGNDHMAVISAADRALYQSKDNGRNRVTVADC